MTESVRVLLVDDSPLALAKLKQIIRRDASIEIVGTAKHGAEALELIPKLDPTVICTDLFMPQMDGLEFTREVMRSHPIPILVVSVGVQETDGDCIFELLKAGALDVLPKPLGGTGADFDSISRELIQKINILSGVKVFRRRDNTALPASTSKPKLSKAQADLPRIALLGASTGGPQTLERILVALPVDLPFPIVCVQHIGAEFIESMVRWMDRAVSIPVRFAKHGEMPLAGTVYFPPQGRQLRFFPNGSFDCNMVELYNNFLPSVDFTFLSAAKCFQKELLACILTGMGCDGTQGIKAIFESGGHTLAQSSESCIIDGMPKSARDAGVIGQVCSPEELVQLLLGFYKLPSKT